MSSWEGDDDAGAAEVDEGVHSGPRQSVSRR